MTYGKFTALPHTVLIVDDSELLRDMLRRTLEISGYTVCEAADGDEALRLYHRHKPDLVLLDATLPGMNGFDTCERLRSLAQEQHLAILMISGLSDIRSFKRAYDSGATDFLPKPFTAITLRQRIADMLNPMPDAVAS